ncbi:hypothetical protein [uncultured Phascolarctobacterium sp.]|uniref:hypothetical protein n=1 Tax=uncultured Phascolarctobacterium sp. TaxID=512296 RepID=UPI0025E3906D|nr:hypothetical protein [uncultured Phascolarctobacterium sp.]
MKRFIYILAFALSILLSSNVFAKNITTTGVGVTEAEATDDALRNALENAVGVLIDSETIVENNTLLNDKVYATSRGFINSYQVVGTQKNVDGWCVTVNAEIDVNQNSKLMDQLTVLGLIDNLLRNPKIAVIIPERHLAYRIPDPAGETAVVNAFIAAGFDNMVDISQDRMRYNSPFNLTDDDLRALANSMQADILVVGEAFSEGIGDVGQFLPKGRRTGTLSCRARVEAKMYIARTGQIIAADGKYGSAVDVSEAIASKKALAVAGKEMGEYLSDKLLELAAGNRRRVELIVMTSGYEKLDSIQQALNNIKGVKNADLSDYTSGKAVFTMRYGGSPQTLFNKIKENVECHVELRSSAYNVLTIAAW